MNVRVSGEAEAMSAIRAVIREETLAFHAKDFERWAACFFHDHRTHDVYMTRARGVIVHRGWEAVANAMRCLMIDNPERIEEGFTQEDFQITVDRDMAWATFYAGCRVTDDRIFRVPDSFETRILERRDGRWSIVYASFATLRTEDRDAPLVQVDEGGTVLWASNRTLAALKGHEGLTVSAGRLRATQPRWDKPLQATFARAAKLRHLFEPDLFAEGVNRMVYPCLLGESEGGGVLHCTVFVRDGAINVSFGDEELVRGKIDAAAEIFALSDGQKRLAREISKGLGLTEAAAALGISINTARTHLGRIYDKTGVNSQPSLVRLMMSVASLAD